MSLANIRFCGACSKQNKQPCRQPAMRNKNRCRLHGGKSTGPKTPEGKLRSARANLKHGLYTNAAIKEKRLMSEMMKWRKDLNEYLT